RNTRRPEETGTSMPSRSDLHIPGNVDGEIQDVVDGALVRTQRHERAFAINVLLVRLAPLEPAAEREWFALAHDAAIECLQYWGMTGRVGLHLGERLALHRKTVSGDMCVTDDAIVIVIAVTGNSDQDGVAQKSAYVAGRD